MLENLNLRDILFLDIETVSQYAGYADLPEHQKALWQKKSFTLSFKQEEFSEATYQRAGIYAEFGKVVCICCAIHPESEKIRMFSFYDDDEHKLLNDFAVFLNDFSAGGRKLLCAHNGKEFDFPFIARRMLIHGIELPDLLNTPGKKPWEVSHLDTMELWKFGDYKSYTSLNLLASVFGIPTPKDDIEGSQVGDVYWNEKDLLRIVRYCQKDVLTIVQIMRKFQRKELLTEIDLSDPQPH